MDEELISKKELLAHTGISYGALYRWKRKKLIPEEWFIKKPMSTGQETFFPKNTMLERIRKIQEMKEDLSLDDLAAKFSTTPISIQTTPEELMATGLVTPAILRVPAVQKGSDIDFFGTLALCICDKLLIKGYVSLIEAEAVIKMIEDNYKYFDSPPRLAIYRSMGSSVSLLIPENVRFCLDGQANHIVTISTSEIWEEIKTKWGG